MNLQRVCIMQRKSIRTRVRGVALVAAPIMLVPGLALGSATYDRARVVDVDPIYETTRYSVPVEQCRDEQVAYAEPTYARRSATGPILGAIIGGALGNAVGHHKRNKQVGTVVGAVLGGSIGADISRRNSYQGSEVRYRSERVCSVSNEIREEERLAGYDVTYAYGGTTYRTRMNRDPGDFIRVRVRVTPAE